MVGMQAEPLAYVCHALPKWISILTPETSRPRLSVGSRHLHDWHYADYGSPPQPPRRQKVPFITQSVCKCVILEF